MGMYSTTHALNQFVISVMSHDRVGIVADVADRISALHGDITDLRQSVLRGYFTMILLATFPPEIDAPTIERQLGAIDAHAEPPLKISVLHATESGSTADAPSPANIYVLTATGSDRIGFVATVAAFCAAHAINILDLATAVQEDQYTMMLQVDLSRCSSPATIQRRLQAFADQHAIHVVLQHNDIFQAIHEIPMPS
jgi:glycine cleavage system transcriptional repressor